MHRLRLYGLRPVGLYRHQRAERHLATGGVGCDHDRPVSQQDPGGQGTAQGRQDAISEITDGTSNTIAVFECAGRDERFVSQYLESLYPFVRGPGPAGMPTGAAPVLAVGRSGLRVRDLRPAQQHGACPRTKAFSGRPRWQRPATRPGPTRSLISFHPAGVNALFGDGSVRFIKDTINLVAFRSLLTINGGETLSSDQY